MLGAWRSAGRDLSRRPALDLRWTRVCFCGQRTEQGPVASSPVLGLPFLTGSEEERGPLYDETGVPFEGRRSPVPMPEQGHKLGVEGVPSEEDTPEAVPLLALRVDDRLVVSYPGEPTAEVGRRLRGAVERSTRGAGIRQVVVSGYANEYLQYFTTPEEYSRQHYEGGSTLFGPRASVLLQEQMAELASRLVDGRPAQPAYPFDPTNGLSPSGGSFGPAATQGMVQREPRHTYRRLREAKFAWHGAPLGHDRPLDDAFVTVERRTRRGWRNATNDLGLEIVWRVDDEGNYRANWEIPINEPRGPHRFRVTARRYTLVSRRFTVRPSRRLQVEELGSARRSRPGGPRLPGRAEAEGHHVPPGTRQRRTGPLRARRRFTNGSAPHGLDVRGLRPSPRHDPESRRPRPLRQPQPRRGEAGRAVRAHSRSQPK